MCNFQGARRRGRAANVQHANLVGSGYMSRATAVCRTGVAKCCEMNRVGICATCPLARRPATMQSASQRCGGLFALLPDGSEIAPEKQV
jgi:hypothetical protein